MSPSGELGIRHGLYLLSVRIRNMPMLYIDVSLAGGHSNTRSCEDF
jgi:hypothetical protein